MPKWLRLSRGAMYPIVVESRFPQALTAVLCGAALAAAGLMMQTIFANPLADPSILGVNAGASLGVAVAMLLLGGSAVACGVSLSGFALTVVAASWFWRYAPCLPPWCVADSSCSLPE